MKSDSLHQDLITDVKNREYVSLSIGQQALWNIYQTTQRSHHYNEGLVARVDEQFDPLLFERSLSLIASRHDVLRSTFFEKNGKVIRKINKNPAFEKHVTEEPDHDRALRLAAKSVNATFDLSKSSWRYCLVKCRSEYYIAVTVHHIIFDMRSFEIFVNEIDDIYSFLKKEFSDRECLNHLKSINTYDKYVIDQIHWLASKNAQSKLAYWKKQLASAPICSTLPPSEGRKCKKEYSGSEYRYSIKVDLAEKVNAFSKHNSISYFQLLFSAFSLLLARYSAQNDLIVGVPSLGRSRQEYKNTIGYFVNLLPIRVSLSTNVTISEWIKEIKKRLYLGIKHQDIPFGYIAQSLFQDGFHNNSPKIDVLFTQITSKDKEKNNITPFFIGEKGGDFTIDNVVFKSCQVERGRSQFDLNLSVVDSEKSISLLVNYREDLYDREYIVDFVESYIQLVENMIEHPEKKIQDIPFISIEQSKKIDQVLNTLENHSTKFKNEMILDWFENSVRCVSNKIALSSNAGSLSYFDLDQKSDILAAYLRASGVGHGDRVALYFENRVLQALASVAVFKVGAAYIPIGVSNPRERLRFFLTDSRPKFIFTERLLVERLPNVDVKHCVIDINLSTISDEHLNTISLSRPFVHDDEIAYCVYTSGSTGKPKGVMVTHKALKNLIQWQKCAFQINTHANASMIAGEGFDVAVAEQWSHLCSGSSLYAPEWETKTHPESLTLWLHEKAITHCFLPTPLAEALLIYLADTSIQLPLDYLLTAGERLKRFKNVNDTFSLVNMYGPAENSPITTSSVIGSKISENNTLYDFPDIGQAIPNQKLYILNNDHQRVPRGSVGELYVGGIGLAQGYIDQPAKTAERFIPNPYASTPGERLYSTGDLVFLDQHSTLHFVGRNDDQIKIRGFRVELGEIEANLIKLPSVKQCKVITTNANTLECSLMAYITLSNEKNTEKVNEKYILDYLAKFLPNYMLPRHVIILDELPLGENGKISKQLLSKIEIPFESTERETYFINSVETYIANIFSSITGVNRIQRTDDFLALGGHSLGASAVIAQIREKYCVKLSINEFFENSTVKNLAKHISTLAHFNESTTFLAHRSDYIPLSDAQNSIWIYQKLNPESVRYNISGTLKIVGELDSQRLENSINAVIDRHEALRTLFLEKEGKPYQYILNKFSIKLQHDIMLPDQPELEKEIRKRYPKTPFELSKPSLIKCVCIKIDHLTHYLVIDTHHILVDGRSIQIILEEVSQYYRTCSFSNSANQYVDSVLADAQYKLNNLYDVDKQYWQKQFADIDFQIQWQDIVGYSEDLSADFSENNTNEGNEICVILGEKHKQRVCDFVKRHSITESIFYLSAFAILLRKVTRLDRVVIGTPYESRETLQSKSTVGLFANILALVIEVNPKDTVEKFFKIVKCISFNAYDHGRFSYDAFIDTCTQNVDIKSRSLIQTVFDFQQHVPLQFSLGNCQAELVLEKERSAKFDLTVSCRDESSFTRIAFNFKRLIFSPEVIEKLLQSYVFILQQLLENPSSPVSAIRMVDDEDQKALIQLGCGQKQILSGLTLVQKFERVAKNHPKWLAVVESRHDNRFTYGELNRNANQLARFFQNQGFNSGDVLAICLPPGIEYTTCILACFKVGGAYLTLDADYPRSRIEAVLENAKPKLIVSEHSYSSGNCKLFQWDECVSIFSDYEITNLNRAIKPGDTAYLMYTSGTTNQPKGLKVPHLALNNLCEWHALYYGLTKHPESIKASQMAGIGFDATVWEIWPYLASGASVWFAPSDIRTSCFKIIEWIENNRITHSFIPTVLVHQMIAENWKGTTYLRYILTGGERLLKYKPQDATYTLVNHYGPSETTVVASFGEVLSKWDYAFYPSIGRPINNVYVYVLDKTRQLVPNQIGGELYIGGISLLSGYCNDQSLWEKTIFSDPYSNVSDAIMYKTGDRVRWNLQGELEFLGRMDDQISLRGYRIEPAEILRSLLSINSVKQAAIKKISRNGTDDYLAGYCVLETDAIDYNDNVARIKKQLKSDLPAYMCPTHIMLLDNLPVTLNGKVWQAALPTPYEASSGIIDETLTPLESQIATIWSELLGVQVRNSNVNFFSIGGHSILAAKAVGHIGSKLKINISLHDFIRAESLKALAIHLENCGLYQQIPHVGSVKEAPISPFQKRLWIIQSLNRTTTSYNVVGGLNLKGEINISEIKKNIFQLILAHDVLRTTFSERENAVFQVVHNKFEESQYLSEFDLRHIQSCEHEQWINAKLKQLSEIPFNLETGPLFKWEILEFSDNYIALLASMHHIIIDEWSLHKLLTDFFDLYLSLSSEKATQLSINLRYIDYSAWANKRLQEDKNKLSKFWSNYLKNASANIIAPLTLKRADSACYLSKTYNVEIVHDYASRIRKVASLHRLSLFDMGFSVYLLWLYQLTSKCDQVVGIPYSDRGKIEIENIVGFFVNILPIKANVNTDLTFIEFIHSVKYQLDQAYENYALPFDKIVECIDCPESLQELTIFNYQSVPHIHTYDRPISANFIESIGEAAMDGFSMTLKDTGDSFVVSCTYFEGIEDNAIIDILVKRYCYLLVTLAHTGNVKIRLNDLCLDPENEINLRTQFENEKTFQGSAVSVLDRFFQIATLHPDLVAIRSEDIVLTYGELNARANALGHLLIENGVKPLDVVGLNEGYSYNNIVAILAIIKSGASYLAINLDWSLERINLILNDAKCRIVISEVKPLNSDEMTCKFIDPSVIINLNFNDLFVALDASFPVTFIYTSGSTGKPKASILHHRGVVNYLNAVQSRYRYTSDDIGLLFAPLTFDASIEEIFGPLSAGAALVIDKRVKSNAISTLVNICEEYNVTLLTLPTAFWRILVERIDEYKIKLEKLRLISIGGEKVSKETLTNWNKNRNNIELWNVYGPSECSIGVVVDRIDQKSYASVIDFVSSIENTQIYILNDDLNPTPIGVEGEIYIGGVGVSHGYNNLPKLTASQFIPNPFAKNGSRLFKTGDLAKYNAQGSVQFIGRKDFQVKIDGIRVEPEEISVTLESYPEVAQAYVMAENTSGPGNPLVGYVTLNQWEGSNKESPVREARLLEYLKDKLPRHMIPRAVVILDRFPLTSHQKIDRSKLPKPKREGLQIFSPGNSFEVFVYDIFRTLLNSSVIAISDTFFSLGGTSLVALKLCIDIESRFNVTLTVRDIFDHPTIPAIAKNIEQAVNKLQKEGSIHVADRVAIKPSVRTSLPLSGAQFRIFYASQMNPQSPIYNLPLMLRLAGELDILTFEKALQHIVEKHESLRTVFRKGEKALYQKILHSIKYDIILDDLQNADEQTIEFWMSTKVKTIFYLDRGPLFSFSLAKIGESEYLLACIFHHIIADGWSIELFKNDLAKYYNLFRLNPSLESTLYTDNEKRKLQYRDFSEWHNKWLDSGARERQLSYWIKTLSGELPLLQLPTDFSISANVSHSGACFNFNLSERLSRDILNYCRSKHTSPFLFLFSAYACLLYRYTHQENFLIGTISHGRIHQEFQTIFGFFVNTLPIRIHAYPGLSFQSLLTKVSQSCFDAFEHQDVSLEEIASKLNLVRDVRSNVFLQTMFSFQEQFDADEAQFDGLSVSEIPVTHDTAKFDLYLSTWMHGDFIHAAFEYASHLFEKSTIKRLAGHFETLLTDIIKDDGRKIENYSLLTSVEHKMLLKKNNGQHLKVITSEFVHQIFEKQVLLKPNGIAVICDKQKSTYAQLNADVNKIAHTLADRTNGRECRVALIIDRNIAYLTAMLGALKSGVAFTPIDPGQINSKYNIILENCQFDFIFVEDKYEIIAEKYRDKSEVLFYEEIIKKETRMHNLDLSPVSFQSLAYVIYTSGSTGVPKGAMIEHGGMINHLQSKIHALKISESDIVAQMAVTTFDVSIWQYLVALLVGGKTVILQGDNAWVPSKLLTEIEKNKITLFESVPSHMKIINDELEVRGDNYQIDHLRLYVSNAEALPPEQCKRWFSVLPQVPIVNTYGATECSDDTSHYFIIDHRQLTRGYIPIHGTIPNMGTYVLDSTLTPVPELVTGEIYLRGVGVGRGYLNDPAQTALSFIPDPFSSEPGSRLYKTGDLARYLTDGTLQFLGRCDFQIKIRGQRVEISEIEVSLCTHPNIHQAVVLDKNDESGQVYLVAYVIAAFFPAPASEDLKVFLEALLPSHMIPLAFILIDEFPLNTNGKIQRDALPIPSKYDLLERTAYEAPKTETESQLSIQWQALFKKDKVSREETFFELGGHSLLVAEHIINIQTIFGLSLPIRTLFEFPRLKDFAKIIDETQQQHQNNNQCVTGISKSPEKSVYPLAPCQVAEWYAYQVDPKSPVYNICISDLFLHGNLNCDAFLHAWDVILARHDVLHIKISADGGKPYQYLGDRFQLDPNDLFIDLTHIPKTNMLQEANRLATELGTKPFDFENGPLFRLKLVSYPNQSHQIIFVVHHIIWDETSLLNLVFELSELYNADILNRPAVLPDLDVNYFDYVQWINDSIRSGAFEKQRVYWLNLFKSLPPPLDLPTDYPRPGIMSFNGDFIQTWLQRDITRQVKRFIKEKNITLFIFKLALIDFYLHRLSGQNDFVIGCPTAGRGDSKLKPLLGLFATPMPIRCQIEPGMTFNDLLNQVSKRTVEALENCQYPANLVIEHLVHKKDLSRPKLFSIMFGVQNNKTDIINQLAFEGLSISFKNVIDTENKSSRFDLTFVVDEYGGDIMFSCVYNTDLYHPETIQSMLRQMTCAISQIIDQPDFLLSQYRFGNDAYSSLGKGNINSCQVRDNIVQLFEDRVDQSPTHNAVFCQNISYSYEVLNIKANQLAHYLLAIGVQRGDTIGVMMQPSFNLVVSLLATLKVGACFAPLGIDYSQKRIDLILDNCAPSIILSESIFMSRFMGFCNQVVCVDTLENILDIYTDSNLPAISSNDSAYILHTSGSTGIPKGIEIMHAGITNMLYAIQNKYHLSKDDKTLFYTSYTFDVFIQEVFWPLAFGASVVIAPNHLSKNTIALLQYINKTQVTVLQVVPLVLESLCEKVEQGEILETSSLRQVICGGSSLSRKLSLRFFSSFDSELANHYGPTESTVDACWFNCKEDYIGNMVPIGYPIDNSNIYLFDENYTRLDPNMIGEIFIESPGLAKGYLNQSVLNQNSFIFLTIDDDKKRLFKTGDLGKFDAKGRLYFQGRRDNQVKIRGNRIELEEINLELNAHPAIAIAGVKPIGDKLAAFIELQPEYNQIQHDNKPYWFFTLEHRPDLVSKYEQFYSAISSVDCTMAGHWQTLMRVYPDFQWCFCDQNENIALIGYSIPLHVDKAFSGNVAIDWEALIFKALNEIQNNGEENTLYVRLESPFAHARTLSMEKVLIDQYIKLASFMHLNHIVFNIASITDIFDLSIFTEKYQVIDENSFLINCNENQCYKHSLISRQLIKTYLRDSLPDYMVPYFVNFVTHIPLTDSGKINVNGLKNSVSTIREHIMLPASDMQIQLLELWKKLLHIEDVDVNSDFFEMGGQSLKATELLATVNEMYSQNIELRQFYESPTILGLEKLIVRENKEINIPEITPENVYDRHK